MEVSMLTVAQNNLNAARQKKNEQKELDNLLRVFEWMDKKGDKKLDADELLLMMKALGHKCSKADAEDMIWEVDEDCDRFVDWEEFKVMFYRVRKDKSGWEPRRLFAVVEFMMHDSVVEVTPWQCPSSAPAPPQGAPGGSGQLGTPRKRHDKDMSHTIDMDECMDILYRRFGKDQLESKVSEFMSKDVDGDMDITFSEFASMDIKSRRMARGT